MSQQQQQSQPSKATIIGHLFLQHYYETLSFSPEKLSGLYVHDAVFSAGEEADDIPSHSGIEAIKNAIEKLDFKGCSAVISSADYQATYNGAVLILTIGKFHRPSKDGNGDSVRRFVQNFLLVPQGQSAYSIMSHSFVLLRDGEDTASSSPVATTAPASSVQQRSAASAAAPAAATPIATPAAASQPASEPAAQQHSAASATTAKHSAPAAAAAADHKAAEHKTAEPKPSATAAAPPAAAAAPPAATTAPAKGASSTPTPAAAAEKPTAQPAAKKTWAAMAAASGSTPSTTTSAPPGVASTTDKPAPVATPAPAATTAITAVPAATATTSAPAGTGAATGAARPPKPVARPADGKAEPSREAFITNLPYTSTEQQVREKFSGYGTIKRLTLHKGAAHIEYDSPDAVVRAIKDAKQKLLELEGRQIHVDDRKRASGGGGAKGGKGPFVPKDQQRRPTGPGSVGGPGAGGDKRPFRPRGQAAGGAGGN